ncbi:MAG: ATP-binding cassette domain-containing protein [Alphaproteobacteria bacterium]
MGGQALPLRPSTILAALCAAGVVAYALTGAGPYQLRVLTLAGVYGLNVIGYQLIFGHAGALSLAQATFFGLGAYATALLSRSLGLDFLLTFPAAILVAGVVALAIAIPVLRLETHYLALATLGVSQVALLVAINWQTVTGGANGLPDVPGIAAFGLALGRGLPTFLAVWACLGIGLMVAARMLSPQRRLRFELQRERPLAAAAVGIDRDRLRLVALLMSAGYGGAAGALYVHTTRVISPDALAFSILVLTLAMTVIGGRLSLAGAILGALLLTQIPEWFRFLDRYYLLAYGAAMLAMVVFAPNGLAALVDRAVPKRASGRGEDRSPPAPASPPRPFPAPRDGEPLPLAIAYLCKAFGGVVAVDVARLEVPPGQVCGIFGPNGSGKTTLLNLVSGFERADRGTIVAFGRELGRLPAFRRAETGIARCFQQAMLLDDRPVLENVAVAVRGSDLRAGRAAALPLLERCGLAALAEQPCRSLSFGQRRLVELARALAGRPRLVLLDEPAAGLADDDLARLGAVMAASRDVTWLIVDHNTTFLAAVADRLVCLDRGAVIADGAPAAVLRDPAVVDAYFGIAAEPGP